MIFIPLWLENTMSRTGMNFSDVLNKEKLLGILSKQDVVFYLLANKLFMEVYGNGTVLETGAINDKYLTDLFESNKDINAEYLVGCNKILSNCETSSLKEHMFLEHALGETIDVDLFKDKKYTLHCQLIDDVNIIVRFKLLNDDVLDYKILGNFYEQILTILNYCYPFNELAKTTLFGKYCRFIGMGIR